MVVCCTLSPLNIYCYSEQTLIYKMSHPSVFSSQYSLNSSYKIRLK